MSVAPNILICDDDPVVHESLGLYLDNDNFKHSDAYDGKESLAMAQATKPDLILLDVMMPGLDGFETYKTLCRRMGPNRQIPVVFLTGNNDEETELKGLELGAFDFIREPVKPKTLPIRVRHALDMSRLKKTNPT